VLYRVEIAPAIEWHATEAIPPAPPRRSGGKQALRRRRRPAPAPLNPAYWRPDLLTARVRRRNPAGPCFRSFPAAASIRGDCCKCRSWLSPGWRRGSPVRWNRGFFDGRHCAAIPCAVQFCDSGRLRVRPAMTDDGCRDCGGGAFVIAGDGRAALRA
jgi:hypothetical protein